MTGTNFDLLRLCIDVNSSSKAWVDAMTQLERSLQIEAAFPPDLHVKEAGFGKRTSNTRELLEVDMKFFYEDLHRTCAEFDRVGKELHFPPGTCLTRVTRNAGGEYEFDDLLKW